MDDKILSTARKLFGERRFAELVGELWLQRSRIWDRWRRDGGELAHILIEWEDRFRRDIEEGRYQVERCKRRRVIRFSEMEGEEPLDRLTFETSRRF